MLKVWASRTVPVLDFISSRWVMAVVFLVTLLGIGFVILPRLDDGAALEAVWKLAVANETPLPTFYAPFTWHFTKLWQGIFGIGDASAILLRFILYGFALYFVWDVAERLFHNRYISALSVYLTLFSPYLTFSIYSNRDISFDVFGVSLFMYYTVRTYFKPTPLNLIMMGFTGGLATLMREPSAIYVPAFVVIFLLLRSINLRHAAVVVVFFVIGLLPLLVWNYIHVQRIVISTRVGENLMVGNHPYYLYGHPNIDIDNFLAPRYFAETATEMATMNPVELEAFYRDIAMDYIRHDIVNTIYRSMLKAYWWIGLNRIPSLSTDAGVYVALDENKIILGDLPNQFQDVMYMLHRAVIILGWLLYWKYSTASWKIALILLLPTLALMPTVMLTFPDTRFRLGADPFSHILAAAGFVFWVVTWWGARVKTPVTTAEELVPAQA